MSSPSIHFHTQFLTADTMDSAVFCRAGIPAAVALYEIADAGEQEAVCMAMDVAARSVFRLRQVVVDAAGQILALSRTPGARDEPEAIAQRTTRRLRYQARRDAKAIASTTSLMPSQVPPQAAVRLAQYTAELKDAAEQGVTRIKELQVSFAEGEE
jgi:hypothetical protein